MITTWQHSNLFKHSHNADVVDYLLSANQRDFELYGVVDRQDGYYYTVVMNKPNGENGLTVTLSTRIPRTDETVKTATYNLQHLAVNVVNEQKQHGLSVITTRVNDFSVSDRPWQSYSAKRLSDSLMVITLHYTSDDKSFSHNQHWTINIGE